MRNSKTGNFAPFGLDSNPEPFDLRVHEPGIESRPRKGTLTATYNSPEVVFKERTLSALASMICGDHQSGLFPYRTNAKLIEFFADSGTTFSTDGSSRGRRTIETLRSILKEPRVSQEAPPTNFLRVIESLMDQADAVQEPPDRPEALHILNTELARENLQAFYGEDKRCYVRNTKTNKVVMSAVNPHRPLDQGEVKKRELLAAYLDKASEDELIEEVLVPLFRYLGFSRITAAGHKDKALEYGKDVWMKYVLPTTNVLYFGLQAKRGKIDSSGVSNASVGEILNQVTMMLGHEIFDPETNRRVLVDHAFIVAGGSITKAARNWLANKLDASKRSQIMFMDRDDILNLFAVTNVPLPSAAQPEPVDPFGLDEIPF